MKVQLAKMELEQLAQKLGLTHYLIDEGTDTKTQSDILVLLDQVSGEVVGKKFL